MEHPDPRVRFFAVRHLGVCYGEAETIIPILIDQLVEPETRYAAIEALRELGPRDKEVAAHLIEYLPAVDGHSRTELLECLSVVDPTLPEPIPYLVDAIRQGCFTWATRALLRYGELAIEPLLTLLRDSGSECAVQVLLELCDSTALPTEMLELVEPDLHPGDMRSLVHCFADRRPEIKDLYIRDLVRNLISGRSNTTGDLSAMGEDALPAVAPLLESPEPRLRRAAVRVFHYSGARSARPALRAALRDDDLLVRLEAAFALATLDEEVDPVPLLLEAFNDEDPDVRKHAARITGALGARVKDVAPVLLEKIEDEAEAALLWRWIRALGELGPEVEFSVARLARQLKRPLIVRETPYFSEIIRILRQKGALPQLSYVRDGQPSVRFYAIQALGAIGGDAKPALPALREALGDELREIREAAEKAIMAITGDPAQARRAAGRSG